MRFYWMLDHVTRRSKILFTRVQVKGKLVLTITNLRKTLIRGGSRTAATSKMERFVIIVNGWKPLTIITKRSILDVAAVLDAPLLMALKT